MPDDLAARVLALVDADAADELADLLAPLTEKQRAALAGRVFEHLQLAVDAGGAGVVAALGCLASGRRIATAMFSCQVRHLGPDATAPIVQVVRDRDPAWLDRLPEILLTGEWAGQHYVVLQALVGAGLLAEPTMPEYVLGLPGIARLDPAVARPYDWGSPLPALRSSAAYRADLWRLLGTERAGRRLQQLDQMSLAPSHFPDQPTPAPQPGLTWLHAVTALAADATLDRDRLLDATLAAFLQDWAPADVTWFVGLHDALQPTLDELDARRTTYGRLLATTPGTTVQVGLAALQRLAAGGRPADDELLRSLGAVLLRSEKGTATTALDLLADVVRRAPDRAAAVSEVARLAAEHARADVRARAARLVLAPDGTNERPRPPTRSEPTGQSPSAHDRRPTGAPASRLADVPASADRSGFDDGRAPSTVVPVADPDELVELFARLMEEVDDPIEVDRLLEGCARLARARPRHLTDAVVGRAEALAAPPRDEYDVVDGLDLRIDLAALLVTWLRGAPARHPRSSRPVGIRYSLAVPSVAPRGSGAVRDRNRADLSLSSLTSRRVHEVAVAVRAGGARLISLPTTVDGAIPRAVLDARLAALGPRDRVLALDAGVAALRVPADELTSGPPAGRRVLGALVGRRGRRPVIDAALATVSATDPRWVRTVGESEDRWGDVNARYVVWADPGSPVRAADDAVSLVIGRRDPLRDAGLDAHESEFGERPDQVTAMWSLLAPNRPDVLASHAHPRLCRALTKNRSGAVPLLAALGGARTPVGAPTCSALVLGMSAKAGDIRTAAADAVADLLGRGHLPAVAVVEQITVLLADDVVVGSRVVQTLVDAARVGPTSAAWVLDVLTGLLPVVVGRRDALRFVEAAADLAEELHRSVVLPPDIAALAASRAGTVLARAARRLAGAG